MTDNDRLAVTICDIVEHQLTKSDIFDVTLKCGASIYSTEDSYNIEIVVAPLVGFDINKKTFERSEPAGDHLETIARELASKYGIVIPGEIYARRRGYSDMITPSLLGQHPANDDEGAFSAYLDLTNGGATIREWDHGEFMIALESGDITVKHVESNISPSDNCYVVIKAYDPASIPAWTDDDYARADEVINDADAAYINFLNEQDEEAA